jgi:hypothetical protein
LAVADHFCFGCEVERLVGRFHVPERAPRADVVTTGSVTSMTP